MARARASGSGSGIAGASRGSGLFQIARNPVPATLVFYNRTLTTFRGTEVDEYGDESDVGIVYLTGVQAALAEVSDTVFDAATQRQQIVRAVKCTVPGFVDIIDTDTVQDEFTGWFYKIEAIEATPGIGYYPAPKRLTLRMRSGISIASD
jgi:hypothetical protein